MAFRKPLHPSSSLHTPPCSGIYPSILCAWFVHLQHLYAGGTDNPQWQGRAHGAVRAHNKEVVLPWPDPRAQFTPGTGWYCRSHCHKTKEREGENSDGLRKENNRQTRNKKRKITRFFFFQSLFGYVSSLMVKPSEAGSQVCSLKDSCYNSSLD